MAYTGHGYHIPGTTKGSLARVPKTPAQCGGVKICPRCKIEAEDTLAMMVESATTPD